MVVRTGVTATTHPLQTDLTPLKFSLSSSLWRLTWTLFKVNEQTLL